jgi:hypothetical protein
VVGDSVDERRKTKAAPTTFVLRLSHGAEEVMYRSALPAAPATPTHRHCRRAGR